MRQTSIFSFLLIISLVSLETSLRIGGVKLGNFILLISCGFILLASIKQARSKGVIIKTGPSDNAFLLFVLCVLFSLLYTPSVKNALFQSLIMITMLFTVVFMSNINVLVFVRAFILTSVIVAVLSLLTIVVAPNIAFQPSPSSDFPELRGILSHQLRLGLLMGLALGYILLLWLNGEINSVFKNRLYLTVYISILLLVLLLAFARLYTFFVLLSIGLTCALGLFKKYRVFLWLGIFSFVSVLIIYGNEIVAYLDSIGFDTTLTGRVRIWEITLDSIKADRSLLGYGFASFDSHVFDYLWGLYRPPHAHSSFVQSYFELGVMGLVVLGILIRANYADIYKNRFEPRRYSYAGFTFFVTFLGSMTGMNYAGKPTLLFYVMFLLISMERTENKKLIQLNQVHEN